MQNKMRGADLTEREASCHIVGAVGEFEANCSGMGKCWDDYCGYFKLKIHTFIKSYRMADIFKIHEVAIHEVAIHEVGAFMRWAN